MYALLAITLAAFSKVTVFFYRGYGFRGVPRLAFSLHGLTRVRNEVEKVESLRPALEGSIITTFRLPTSSLNHPPTTP